MSTQPKLGRISSIRDRVEDTLSAHRNELISLLSRYAAQGKGILQPHNLIDELDNIPGDDEAIVDLKNGPFGEIVKPAKEAIVLPPFVAIAIRPRPGVWEYVRVNVSDLSVEQLSIFEYLSFKEELVDGKINENFVLELDFEPFPRPTRSASIGNGVQFLNRHLSSIMFHNKDSLQPLLDFLRVHKYKGHLRELALTNIGSIHKRANLSKKLSVLSPEELRDFVCCKLHIQIIKFLLILRNQCEINVYFWCNNLMILAPILKISLNKIQLDLHPPR
ncbi:Sucrose synthase 2 isoform B [Glycine soja]|uniref:sucrose synthase n=1 Tax=Glycine soja TaxID=3848 RepID=A0A445L117_GLYSO|nr:Sucrose synthase 2 isoform B [Glycine soja]